MLLRFKNRLDDGPTLQCHTQILALKEGQKLPFSQCSAVFCHRLKYRFKTGGLKFKVPGRKWQIGRNDDLSHQYGRRIDARPGIKQPSAIYLSAARGQR